MPNRRQRPEHIKLERIFARLLTIGFLLAPAIAQAQTVTGGISPGTILNNFCSFILGPFGQSLAVLGIIGVGLRWMFGRLSLGVVAGTIGGIVLVFGASFLEQTFLGS